MVAGLAIRRCCRMVRNWSRHSDRLINAVQIDRQRGRGSAPLVVADRVGGNRDRAIVVQRRCKGVATISIDHQLADSCAVLASQRRCASCCKRVGLTVSVCINLEFGHHQLVAVRVAIGLVACSCTSQYVTADGRVFVGCCLVIESLWSWVAHLHLEGLLHGFTRWVFGLDCYGVGTVFTWTALTARGINLAGNQPCVLINTQAGWQASGLVGQRVTIHILEAARSGNAHHACVFSNLRGQRAHGHRGIVDGGDLNIDSCRICITIGVFHCIVKVHRTVVIGIRHKAHAAVRCNFYLAIGHGDALHATCDRNTIDVSDLQATVRGAVIIQQGQRHRAVFSHGVAVVLCVNRIVNGRNVYRYGTGRGLTIRVGHDHFERVLPMPVWIGRVGVAAVGLDGDLAVGRWGAAGVGQGVAIGVAAHDLAGDGRVFRGLVAVVRCRRGIVDRRHRHAHSNRSGRPIRVGNHNREIIWPVVARMWCVGVAAIRFERDSTVFGVRAFAVNRSPATCRRFNFSADRLIFWGLDCWRDQRRSHPSLGPIARTTGDLTTTRTSATTTATAACCTSYTSYTKSSQRTDQPFIRRHQQRFIPFNFRKVELGPGRCVLSPPPDTLLILKNQVVATFVVVEGEEILQHGFAAVFQHQHQIVRTTLEADYAFWRNLQMDDRGMLQRQLVCGDFTS